MLRAVLRDLRAHPGRVSMTLVAIVLGVGFVVATWVVSDSAAATIVSGQTRADFAVIVRTKDPAPLASIARAEGVVFGHSAVVKSDGKLGTGYFPEMAGTDWDASDRFHLIGGRGPEKAGEVALEERTAKDAGHGVGSSVRLLRQDGTSETVTVVGIYTYRTAAADEPMPVVAYDEATALRLAGGSFAWVELFGADPDAIAAQAKAKGFEDVKTRQQIADERAKEASQEAQIARNFLLVFAGVALMVGMFVIANTFTMLVAQRTRYFALLRAVGAKRRQVRRAILAEAAVIGLIGATVGAALGVGLGWVAMTLLRSTGETVIFAVSPLAILVGYLVGLVVTVVAAYGSARRGAAVPPVAALGTDYALPRRSLVIRTVLGFLALGGGTTMVLLTSHTDLSDWQRVVGMAGALLGCVGLLLLAPLLASAVLIPLSRVVSQRGSVVARVAVRNSIRDPRRTAATASALMIGLALVTAFATVGESLSDTFSRVVKADIRAETLVVRGVNGPTQDDIVPKVPGDATAVYHGWGEVDGRDRSITVVRGNGKGLARELPRGGALVREQFGKKVGDTVTVMGKTLRINGVYVDESFLYNGVVVDDPALLGEHSYLDGVYVADADRRALDAAFAERPDIIVMDREQLIMEFIGPLQLALGIVYALLGAAVLIAVFGVVNTLALSVLERTREIGVFRAVGASRGLVRRAIRRESVVIATYGGLLGVGIGVLLGGVMQHVILSQPIFSMAVPLPVVAGALGGMVVVGVLAALWPARRAARTDVLAAIATT
ncbi:ABC transporter permease [Allorhizocola rhizosphaerae]|uniref:ABC transporter permease n=1 Tax=Allorhizocola rhizosphaerae TaxID=1872709 RepID=UPI000E3D3510|nr:FtsX-like permease family protein [Allorhizocola rhizosphaerae]